MNLDHIEDALHGASPEIVARSHWLISILQHSDGIKPLLNHPDTRCRLAATTFYSHYGNHDPRLQ